MDVSRGTTPAAHRYQPLLLMPLVLGASLLGIVTRQPEHTAVFWITNALLLGVLLRYPSLARPLGWLAALAGYLMADLLTGSSWQKALWLTGGNLVGVVTGFVLFSRYGARRISLQRSDSILFLILFTLCAAVASGLVGLVIEPLLFGGTMRGGFAYWLIAEWFSYLAVLPVILTLPRRSCQRHSDRQWHWPPWKKLAPLLVLLGSFAVAMLLGGPGAVAYAVPALLWCALSYSVFQTAVLTLLFCVMTLWAISSGWLDLGVSLGQQEQISLRLGILLMALGPLTASNVMASRNNLQRRLRYLAWHDSLTGTLNRAGFMERAAELLGQPSAPAMAVLMLDIDHFKKINDSCGHAGGDQVLLVFATRVQGCLREQDILGRLGGEEFAVLLPACQASEALQVAERIRATVEATAMPLDDQEPLRVTVSIGLAVAPPLASDISTLLSAADEALYRAKHEGRNRVRQA